MIREHSARRPAKEAVIELVLAVPGLRLVCGCAKYRPRHPGEGRDLPCCKSLRPYSLSPILPALHRYCGGMDPACPTDQVRGLKAHGMTVMPVRAATELQGRKARDQATTAPEFSSSGNSLQEFSEGRRRGRLDPGLRRGDERRRQPFCFTASESSDGSFMSPRHFVQRDGDVIYRTVCQGCHMPDARGAVGAGAYPALAADARLAEAEYPVLVVVNGSKGMPP